METILLIATISILNIVCFFIGAETGQKVVKDEPIELPNINPVKAINEYKETKELKEEKERLNTMLENINNYTPDGLGQKDIN